MNENLNISLGGHVRAYIIDSAGNKQLVVDKPNGTQPNANVVVANLLAGTIGYDLGFVKAFKTGSLLADSPNGVVTLPSSTQVEVDCIFDELSFNDTLDEVRMHSKLGGVVSLLTGLSITKDNTVKLQVIWSFTINAT